MTRFTLIPHSDFPPLAVTGIHVEVTRNDGEITLNYCVDGTASLHVPPPANPERIDGLWRTTCCELFLRPNDAKNYVELNFAPSGQWAAYAFDRYREGMRNLNIAAPRIAWTGERLTAVLRYPGPIPGDGGGCAMGLTAVIEEEGGRKSYWSLAHPPEKPDFHHDACFAATLPAPAAP